MKKTLYTCLGIVAFFAAACNAPSTETTKEPADPKESAAERNKKSIMASMDAINKHDVGSVLKDAAPDLTEYGDGQGPVVHGVDSVNMMLKGWMTAFPDYKQENLEYAADGNKVMVASDCSGTWKGDLMGMKPTGKSFKVRDVDIFTFNDAGKIIAHRATQSMGPVMASIGMSAPAAAAHEKAGAAERK